MGIIEGSSAVLFALGIFVLTYIIRSVVQYAWKDWKKNLFYNELVLHLLPIALGALLSLSKTYPWPDLIAGSRLGKLFFGMALGMFCGLIYSRVRGLAKGRLADSLPKTEEVVADDAPPTVEDRPTPKIP